MPETPTVRIRNTAYSLLPVKHLIPHPDNPWQHSEEEKKDFLDEIAKRGFAGMLLVRPHPKERERFEILDGEMRSGLLPNETLPCIITDYNDEEAREVVRRHNLLGHLSTTLDPELLARMKSAEDDLPEPGEAEELLRGAPSPDGTQSEQPADIVKEQRKEIKPESPSTYRWVLLGLPVSEWGKAQPHIAALEAMSAITVQKSGGDGTA